MPGFYEAAGQAMRSSTTRAKCSQVADRIASTLRSVTAAEGLDVSIGRTNGTRPKGRPVSRVTITGTDEWGDSGQPKRRIIARATSAAARTGRR